MRSEAAWKKMSAAASEAEPLGEGATDAGFVLADVASRRRMNRSALVQTICTLLRIGIMCVGRCMKAGLGQCNPPMEISGSCEEACLA